jgi:hypothetical protein
MITPDHFGDQAVRLVKVSTHRTDGPLSQTWHEVSFYKLVNRGYGIAVDHHEGGRLDTIYQERALSEGGNDLLKGARTLDLISFLHDARDTEEITQAFRVSIDRLEDRWRSLITMAIDEPITLVGYVPGGNAVLVNDAVLGAAILSDGNPMKRGEISEEVTPPKIWIKTMDGRMALPLEHANKTGLGRPAFNELKPPGYVSSYPAMTTEEFIERWKVFRGTR